jgi:carboxylate-amine ligase
MAGTPQVFTTRAEYDQLVEALVATGSITDGTNIYWDVRPSARFETLEFRVADVSLTVDEAVMMAGLVRALARACYVQAAHDEPSFDVRPELLRAAKWQAARFGLEADLIDVKARSAIPAMAMVEKLLAFLRPSLQEVGDWDEISGLVNGMATNGTGAKRQRKLYARSGRFEDVVDFIIAETKKGVL